MMIGLEPVWMPRKATKWLLVVNGGLRAFVPSLATACRWKAYWRRRRAAIGLFGEQTYEASRLR